MEDIFLKRELEILEDVKSVAHEYGITSGGYFSVQEYLRKGKYSKYAIHENARGWRYYCEKADYKAKIKEKLHGEFEGQVSILCLV